MGNFTTEVKTKILERVKSIAKVVSETYDLNIDVESIGAPCTDGRSNIHLTDPEYYANVYDITDENDLVTLSLSSAMHEAEHILHTGHADDNGFAKFLNECSRKGYSLDRLRDLVNMIEDYRIENLTAIDRPGTKLYSRACADIVCKLGILGAKHHVPPEFVAMTDMFASKSYEEVIKELNRPDLSLDTNDFYTPKIKEYIKAIEEAMKSIDLVNSSVNTSMQLAQKLYDIYVLGNEPKNMASSSSGKDKGDNKGEKGKGQSPEGNNGDDNDEQSQEDEDTNNSEQPEEENLSEYLKRDKIKQMNGMLDEASTQVNRLDNLITGTSSKKAIYKNHKRDERDFLSDCETKLKRGMYFGGRSFTKINKYEDLTNVKNPKAILKKARNNASSNTQAYYAFAYENNIKCSAPKSSDKGKIDNLVRSVKSAMLKALDNSTYYKKSGRLDTKRLWSSTSNSMDLFYRNKLKSKGGIAVYLLVDNSGSMEGTKISNARNITRIILRAMIELGIPCKCVGFAEEGDLNHGTLHCEVKDWESKDIYMDIMQDRGCNRDGFSIRLAYQELDQRPEEHKLLIIMSDGQPAGHEYGYGGGGNTKPRNNHSNGWISAISDTAKAVREARKLGQKVVGVYLRPHLGSFKSIFIDRCNDNNGNIGRVDKAQSILKSMYGNDFIVPDAGTLNDFLPKFTSIICKVLKD